MNQYDLIEYGYRVFGLYGGNPDGTCKCGNPDCDAAYKHPIASNWQYTPDWSDEQLEVMHETGQFDTGYGVLVKGLLVIDVDARNGGVASFDKLCTDLKTNLLSYCGLVVSTGSGGGSMHLYFSLDTEIALMQKHNDYPGIDFKSSGFVVGPGSLHVSGNSYEVMQGDAGQITSVPASLVRMLKKPDRFRAQTSLGNFDVEKGDIKEMLDCVSPDCDHDTWLNCGMAIHHTLGGDGFEMWDEWSRLSRDKYPGVHNLEKRWHSFGKSANPVTLGTLIFHAQAGGYTAPVEFECTEVFEEVETEIDISGVDLRRPPGFVGQLTEWINAQCLYPRETAAVATALTAIGNIAGMRCEDAQDGMSANMLAFCVAPSSTGKEALQKSFTEIMKAAGISAAVHGGIKSEQEIIRNLVRNQAAFYCIDEMGIVLRKILNAGKRGGASYLEGVIGLIMSAYSKADSFMAISGDVKDAVKSELNNEAAICNKKIDENEDKNGSYQARLEQINRALSSIDSGLERPFLSLLGFTTPVTFNDLIEYESATNGFLSRAMIFDEPESNPRRKKHFKKKPMPDNMAATLYSMYQPGSYDSLDNISRVEHYGERSQIKTMAGASAMLDLVYESFWDMAESAKEKGLEAIPRRGYELCAKISFILALPEGVRTIEHVRWSYALTKMDIERKMRLAYANVNEKEDPVNAIAAKIQNILENCEGGQTQGVIVNRCRPHKKEDVIKVIQTLVESGMINKIEYEANNKSKKMTVRYEVA